MQVVEEDRSFAMQVADGRRRAEALAFSPEKVVLERRWVALQPVGGLVVVHAGIDVAEENLAKIQLHEGHASADLDLVHPVYEGPK